VDRQTTTSRLPTELHGVSAQQDSEKNGSECELYNEAFYIPWAGDPEFTGTEKRVRLSERQTRFFAIFQ
jgi:hypothetical protein